MTTRRMHPNQPDAFAFTPENLEWAEGQIGKFPEGRQASAVIPLLFRAQEQEGWLTRPAIEAVAAMLEMPVIRVLEVATFYFMFRLAPIGRIAHIEVCGTTPCMLCGAEDLAAVCREEINAAPHALSEDGLFSWEEVECLGACANAPMIQIGKDYYEDLDSESFRALLGEFRAWAGGAGARPRPGSRKGRFSSEPLGGATSLLSDARSHEDNASVALALGQDAEPRLISGGSRVASAASPASGVALALAEGEEPAPDAWRPASAPKPLGGGDDLKRIKGVGPQLEALLHELGFFHFRQIAVWTQENQRWVDQHLAGFRGRIARDDWVGQAKLLAEGARSAGDAPADG